MADKKVPDNKTTTVKNTVPPKSTTTAAKPAAAAKPATTTAKPAAKPSTTTAAKPTTKTATPATPAKPVAKTTPTTAAKPATTTTAKPAATAKPATTAAKPATTATKPAATATTAKPVAKSTPTTTAKPTAKTTTATSATAKPAAKADTATTATKPAAKTATAETVEKPAATKTADKKAVNAKSAEKPSKNKAVADSTGNENSKATNPIKAFAAMDPKKRLKIIITTAVAFVLVIAIVLGSVLGVRSCNPDSSFFVATKTVQDDRPVTTEKTILPTVTNTTTKDTYDFQYEASTIVGFTGEYLGTVDEINKPVEEMKNEGRVPQDKYPTYGSTKSMDTDQKNALINEADYLCATKTFVDVSGFKRDSIRSYDGMDKDGWLFRVVNNERVPSVDYDGNPRQFYAHTASKGMYLGNVSDDEPRIIKRVTMRHRSYGCHGVTGLYAPAGEIIKIEISAEDLKATGGELTIYIGQALFNGQANNIWAQKGMNRMPLILNTMRVNKNTATLENGVYTAYVGSFLGGPLYISNPGATITATISGCVAYSHFILGYTTREEFERNAQSTAPYFDLEVWDRGVLHSGPKRYAQSFSYDDIYKAAELWEKISLVSTQRSNQGIVFLYDPFVAAGAAVAFPGRRSVNCPSGWMSQALNYNSFVQSGTWGNMHEYNHNFQGYGCGGGADGEVTNNALNIVEYSLFTKISGRRGIGSYGTQNVGGGWNNYTVGTWTLQRVKDKAITSTNGLAVYATLIHNFGQDAFMRASINSNGATKYFTRFGQEVHQDMSYYENLVHAYSSGADNAAIHEAQKEYPMFVPVSCVYQTGRGYKYDGQSKYFNTMQPYLIPYGEEFNIDLSEYTTDNGQYKSGSIVVPDGITYKIKKVSRPKNGSISATSNTNLKFKPNKTLRSGQIIVTLELKQTAEHIEQYGKFKMDDVDLILEFEQTHAKKGTTLERTTYTYSADKMPTDAEAAFNSNYSGYTSKSTIDHSNPTQNCNTDIWYYPDTEENRNNYPEHYVLKDNTVAEVSGKLYFAEDGTYRVYLRGRNNCALFYSLNGNSYSLGAKITKDTAVTNNKTYLFRPASESGTYFDIRFDEGKVYVKSGAAVSFPTSPTYTIKKNEYNEYENWLYIKEVLIVKKDANSFIGVGMRQWTQTMFTINETYHKADNTTVDSPTADGYAYTKTTYLDYVGNEVAYSRKDKDSANVQYFKKVGNAYEASTADEVAKLTESKMLAPTVTESSQPYVSGYRSNYEFVNNAFEGDYFYKRSYTSSYNGNPVMITGDEVTQTYTDGNYVPWANTDEFPIENLFDGKTGTYIHSGNGNQYKVSESNPAIFNVELSEKITTKYLRLYPSNKDANHKSAFPKNFKIEGSLDGEKYFDMGSWTDQTATGATFYNYTLSKAYTFKYYRLTVTETSSSSQRLALSDIAFLDQLELTLQNGTNMTLDNEYITFKGAWEIENTPSTYGHVYKGQKNATYEFKFNGARLGIYTTTLYGKDYKVYIDGKEMKSVLINDNSASADWTYTYISDLLKNGSHTVKIQCTGEVGFDSVVIWDI